ncbi:hypothetical protein C5167_029552 [Papaver somniferum]|nr:hypothetical protein C5167_029552 [Papaver somniferum]
MLTAYAENNVITKARRLFDEMTQLNTATWNAMITAYTRSTCHINEVYELFCKVPERNVVTYAVTITRFFRVRMLNEVEKIYYEMPEIGRDLVVSNAMIKGYLKLGELDRAVFVFDSMVERNVISWSSILHGYCRNGKVSDAEVLFQKMPENNVVSWTTMISGYMKSGQWVKGDIDNRSGPLSKFIEKFCNVKLLKISGAYFKILKRAKVLSTSFPTFGNLIRLEVYDIQMKT